MKKLIGIFIISIFMISMVYASAAAAAAAAAASSSANAAAVSKADRMRGECTKPLDFELENSCVLKYESRTSWKSFYCDTNTLRYYVDADCDGNIISYNYETWEQIKERNKIIIMVMVLAALFIILVFSIITLINSRQGKSW